MNIKTGIDLVHIPRMEKLLGNKAALQKIFHDSELKRMDAGHLAGIFALKEAFFKALSLKPRFLALEIIQKGNKKPAINVSPQLELKNIISLDANVSHDRDYAIASVVVLLK